MSKKEIQTLSHAHAQYPELLSEIPHPPKTLHVIGSLDSEKPHIAIVGTRKATKKGLDTSRLFARELGHAGAVIVSGLALGIDSAAHQGALDTGAPTVAVLANGLDTIYPRHNEQLAQKIIEKDGALLSEYPKGTPSYPNQFIERNRIISGLSLGVLVVEAPERSGALATVRFALEQNRDVFVVPGPIDHPNYKGSHKLIQEGAMLVTSPNDILDALNIAPKLDKQKEYRVAYPNIGVEEGRIIATLKTSGTPMTLDSIIQATSIDPKSATRLVSMLVIQGILKEDGGRYML